MQIGSLEAIKMVSDAGGSQALRTISEMSIENIVSGNLKRIIKGGHR